MASGRDLLFVYGTLKRGGTRHGFLSQAEFLGPARTGLRCRLYDCGGYPGLVIDPTGYAVSGELYVIPPSCLEMCDVEEGTEEGLYRRRRIPVVREGMSGRAVRAWTYCWQRSVASLRECGPEWLPDGVPDE